MKKMTKFKRKQKTKSKADAILCADLHIRPDAPICRTDNFFDAMENKINFILDLSKQHDCPILVAGDLGNHALNNGWPTWLLNWTIEKFDCVQYFEYDNARSNLFVIPGQHDLPNHRLDLLKKSGIGVLAKAGKIKLFEKKEAVNIKDKFNLFAFPYGIEIEDPWPFDTSLHGPNIAIIHQMIIKNKPLWPGQNASKGHQILKKFPRYDLILSGDNHNSFVVEYQGRKLVNPGSMMRTTIDQENHEPQVYLWYANTNEIETVYLPIKKNVISRTHIEIAKKRESRNASFIRRINNDIEIKLSYEKNISAYFNRYRTQKRIIEKTWEAIEN
jgi:predicted phosphodiesterase